MYDQLKNIDAKEVQLPETVFIRDIETRVFQAIATQCLSKIEGISLIAGTFFDALFGRELENVKGVTVEQDQERHSVDIHVEVNICYGIEIPKKAEEIQMKLAQEISAWTGLHVASVHVVFKDLVAPVETATPS